MTVPHGTYSRYQHYSCRCAPCTEANRQAGERGRLQRKARAIPDTVEHGRSAYLNWGCRCEICKKAQNTYMREYNQRSARKRRQAS